MDKAILFSGGLDSLWLKTFIPDADLVYFNLGTAYSKWELKNLPARTSIINVNISAKELGDGKEVLNRNLYLISRLALTYKAIYIGSTADDKKFDNSEEFFSNLQKVLKGSKVIAPLLHKRKQQIYNELVEELPTVEYFTCYNPTGNTPCGICAACALDNTIVKVSVNKFYEEDLDEIKAINVYALQDAGIYDHTIVDTFDSDWWVTLKNKKTGEIVGYCGIKDNVLIKVRVNPKYKGKGFGKMLNNMAFRISQPGMKVYSCNPAQIRMSMDRGCRLSGWDNKFFELEKI